MTATSGHGAFAFAFDVWDSPPAWFEVPDDDLQPELLALCIEHAHAAIDGDVSLAGAFAGIDAAIRAHHEDPECGLLYKGSSAMAAALAIAGGTVTIAWSGIASVHRIRDVRAVQLSVDHSVAAEQRRAGATEIEEWHNGIITRVLGFPAEGNDGFETSTFAVAPGDRYLVLAGDPLRALDVSRFATGAPPHELAAALLRDAAVRCPGESASAIVVALP